jgi:hypothetical protein
MRRLLAAAACGAVLLLGAGCTADSSPEPAVTTAAPVPSAGGGPAGASGAPGASGAANPGDVALATNLSAICNQATKVSGSSIANFASNAEDLKKAAAGSDKNELAKAAARSQGPVQNWSFAMKNLGQLVADAGLKDAFGKAGDELEKLGATDPTKIDQAKLTEVQGNIAKACAGK